VNSDHDAAHQMLAISLHYISLFYHFISILGIDIEILIGFSPSLSFYMSEDYFVGLRYEGGRKYC